MLAITLTQPWATLVATGAKRIETRSWSADYRGRIAIHAAKSWPRWAIEVSFTEPFKTVIREASERFGYQKLGDLPRGSIVAVGELVGCFRITRSLTYALADKRDGVLRDWRVDLSKGHELDFGDFSPGRYGWAFDKIRALSEPVPCRGATGLWSLLPNVKREVMSRVP